MVTLNADGSPQVSCVWITMDGDDLVMMHTAEHVKVRNLRRLQALLEPDHPESKG